MHRTPRTSASTGLSPGQFYGNVARRRCEGGMVLSEIWHREPRSLPAHDHQSPGVYLLLGGDYRELLGPRVEVHRPRSAVFHPAAFRHRDVIGRGGARMFAVELSGPLLARVGELLPKEPRRDRGGLLATLVSRLHAELEADDPAAPLVREGIVYELVGALGRQPAEAAPHWLVRADEALRAGIDQPWGLGTLAAEAGVHPARLARGFRRTFGESVGERLRRLRLEAAREAIARPGSDLAAIAQDCGFADQSHLTRAFRGAYGLTPGAFRRRCTGARRVSAR